jgi:MazG family protein
VNEPQAATTPPFPPAAGHLDDALQLVEFLRAGCPWDAVQTHQSLRRYLLEETHEVIDAIDAGDDRALSDELGDLLLNLAFQIIIGEERGAFDRVMVVNGLKAKMRRRHPALYGDGEAVSWDAAKAAERGESIRDDGSILSDVLPGTDSLAHAHRIQARAASVGFDWPDAYGALAKVREEVDEVADELEAADPARLEDELGDLLFAVVNLARLGGVHPSTALSRASTKFERRFRGVEKRAAGRGLTLETAGLEALDAIWDEIKREER